MSDMRALYQEVILDHNKSPRNYGSLVKPNRVAEGDNPLCGDHIKIELQVDGDTVKDIAFEGQGCAICKASASMLTTVIKNKDTKYAFDMIDEFRDMITSKPSDTVSDSGNLGRLKIFANIRTLPTRVKCAILPWHTLNAALKNDNADAANQETVSVSTESDY